MPALTDSVHHRRAFLRWTFAGCLLVLLALAWPRITHAEPASPGYAGPETCAQCHPDEAATWQASPHAQALQALGESVERVCGEGDSATGCECLSCHTTDFDPQQGTYAHAGVTCEACHGPYVPGHPQDGTMQLPVDASSCQNCHTATYQQWHETAHSDAGVQCISCHLPHTQETRLASEELCQSCHRDEAEEWAHQGAGVHCTDCHISSPTVAGASDVQVKGPGSAPNHSFEQAVEACVDCHGQGIHIEAVDTATGAIGSSQLLEMRERARELALQLEDAQHTHRSLQTLSVVSFGFGLGSGGVLGMIFVLVVGYVSQGRIKR